jgi:hypothetical protein
MAQLFRPVASRHAGFNRQATRREMMTKNALDEATIRTLMDDIANAVRAKDADGVLSHYVRNPLHFARAVFLTF